MKMKKESKVFVDWKYLYKNVTKVAAIQDQETLLRLLASERILISIFNLRKKFAIPTFDGYGAKNLLANGQSTFLMQGIRQEILYEYDISDRWLYFLHHFIVHGFENTMKFATSRSHDEMSAKAIELLCQIEKSRQEKASPKARQHSGKYSIRENDVQIDEKNNKVIIAFDASSSWAELNAMKPLIELMREHLNSLHPLRAKKSNLKDFPSTKRNILLSWCHAEGIRKPKDMRRRLHEIADELGFSLHERKDFEPENLEQQMKRLRKVIEA